MLRGGTGDPSRSRDRVHQAAELAMTEPRDLAPATVNDALARVAGNNEVARAKRLYRHLFDFCRLGPSAALDDLLDHRAGGLARFMLPVIISTADDQPCLVPDDLRANGKAAGFEAGGYR